MSNLLIGLIIIDAVTIVGILFLEHLRRKRYKKEMDRINRGYKSKINKNF